METEVEKEVFRKAADHVLAGEYAVAVEELSVALQANSDAGRLWELQGQAHLALGDATEAVGCLEHAMCLVPLSIEGRLALGHGYELTGRKEVAKSAFVQLASEDNLPLVVFEPLARALGRANEQALALGVCTEAARRTPDSSAPLMGMVFYQRQLGFKPDRVLPLLFRAFHLDPDDFDIRLTLARMLHECGQAQEAAELLSVVEIETSRCPSCLVAMQQIFEEAGDQHRVGQCVDALIALAE